MQIALKRGQHLTEQLVIGLEGGNLGGMGVEALLAGRPSPFFASGTGDVGMAVEALHFVLLVDIHLLWALSAGLGMRDVDE